MKTQNSKAKLGRNKAVRCSAWFGHGWVITRISLKLVAEKWWQENRNLSAHIFLPDPSLELSQPSALKTESPEPLVSKNRRSKISTRGSGRTIRAQPRRAKGREPRSGTRTAP